MAEELQRVPPNTIIVPIIKKASHIFHWLNFSKVNTAGRMLFWSKCLAFLSSGCEETRKHQVQVTMSVSFVADACKTERTTRHHKDISGADFVI